MPTIAEALAIAWQHQQQGRYREAEHLYRQIVDAAPTHSDAWCLLGAVCQAQGRLQEAEANLQRAVALMPNHPSANNFLGAVLGQQGKLDEAAAAFESSLHFQPQDAEAWNNLGLVRIQQQRPGEAADHLRKALHLQPVWDAAHYNLGNALYLRGQVDEAIAQYKEALKLNPAYAEAHTNLADALRNQGKTQEAIEHFHRALCIRKDLPETHANLALAHQVEGDIEKATVHFQEACRLKPDNRTRAQFAMLLPPIYQSLADLQSWRQRLIDQVRQLHAENFQLDLTNETALPPFYLAYQGSNDRNLQREIARLYRAPSLVSESAAGPRRRGGKIRVGFLSAHFRMHTIGHLMRGLIAHLSRDVFEVTVLSVGDYQDEIAAFLKQQADRYLVVPRQLPAARRMIADQWLDVLFYTDIGMEAITYSLAFSRLAGVQCVTWGHPVTTGMASIDYFISGEDLEPAPAEAEQHYTEKLIRLKRMPIYYYKPEQAGPRRTREYFGIGGSVHIYSCPQMLFKFHPEFDSLLGGILRGDPQATLVLISGKPQLEQLLRQRFATTIPDVLDRVRFLPMVSRDDFLNLLALSDVLLDPLHFGGGNTSYESFALGIPIVTLPSRLLRGRITYSLYKQMGISDCIAKDAEDYIRIALQLGMDRQYRNTISRKIVAANEVLFHNTEGIVELEQFFQSAVNVTQ